MGTSQLRSDVCRCVAHATQGIVSRAVSAGGLKALMLMLASGAAQAESKASTVLACMADGSKEVQAKIISEGGVEALIRMLSEGMSLDAQAEAAGALWSLAWANTTAHPSAALPSPCRQPRRRRHLASS